jgi:hypothetical protein
MRGQQPHSPLQQGLPIDFHTGFVTTEATAAPARQYQAVERGGRRVHADAAW